jgi:DNA-binding CsgD family transcriptional regulator
MTKSIIDKLQRENASSNNLSLPSEQDSESFQILQSENKHLRDLVGSLIDMLLRDITLDPLGDHRAAEVLATARTHHFTVVQQKGIWKIFRTAEAPATIHSLTPREVEVLTWAARGMSASQIGEILHIAKRTVDEHVQAAARKLGAANRTQAVAIALLSHIIEVDT